jgi:hypothetical protein
MLISNCSFFSFEQEPLHLLHCLLILGLLLLLQLHHLLLYILGVACVHLHSVKHVIYRPLVVPHLLVSLAPPVEGFVGFSAVKGE